MAPFLLLASNLNNINPDQAASFMLLGGFLPVIAVLLCIALFIVIPLIGFLPSIIGRNKKNCRAILILNIFGGILFGLGWIIALVWACMEDSEEDEMRARPLNIRGVLLIAYLLQVVSMVVVFWLEYSVWKAANAEERKAIAEQTETVPASSASAPSSEPTPTLPIVLPPPPVAKWSELAEICGTVEAANGGVLVVDCGTEYSEKYGPLQMVSNGVLRWVPPDNAPTERPVGRLAVFGYPATADTDHIHVVAAPTGAEYEGAPLYAANFTLGAAVATTHSIYPPGVDTPEQRREYLQALAAARKAAHGQ